MYDDHYSYRTRGYQPDHYRDSRQVRRTVEEHHIGRERRPSPVVQHTRTIVSERRSPSPPPQTNTIVRREVRVTEDKPPETVVRRSPLQTDRVVHEIVKHNRIEPERLVVHKYDDRPTRNTYSHVSISSPTSSHDSWRPTTTTTNNNRYYEDRNPVSWYKRERSAQRQRLHDNIDKRQRHQDVVNTLYRDGSNVNDPSYRSSWTRQY
jgi:hypothetical protein